MTEQDKGGEGSLEFTIKDIEAYLHVSLEEVEVKWKDCKHMQVLLDHQAHTVTCRACAKVLDPFWYLCLLSQEWKQRRYADEGAKNAWEKLRQRDEQDRAKGQTFMRPAKPGPAQEAWDIYVAYYDEPPYSVYYSCRQWMAASSDSESESVPYILMRLARRQRGLQRYL